MKLITNYQELLTNIQTLEEYKNSNRFKEYFTKLIKRGTCFIVLENDKNMIFAPSRFVGYQNNTMEKHENNTRKDGRITNGVINEILGFKPETNTSIEESYKKYCIELGVVPNEIGAFGVERKFWLIKN